MPNNSWGLPYPLGTDAADGPDAIKDLADAVGPYLNKSYATAAARDGLIPAPIAGMIAFLLDTGTWSGYGGDAYRPFPFAVGVATCTVSGTGAASYSNTFTWPAGRFTAAPFSFITNNGGTGSSAFYAQLNSPPTTTGGTVLVSHRDNTVTALTAMTVHVIGVQMLGSAAAG